MSVLALLSQQLCLYLKATRWIVLLLFQRLACAFEQVQLSPTSSDEEAIRQCRSIRDCLSW